jgi:hypothetical protein
MINDPLPSDFWTLEEQELLAVLLPLLEEMARDGIAISLDELAGYSVTADPADASARTSAWARAYVGELIRKINPTTRASVGEAVANWFETPGATIGDLSRNLQRILGSNEYRAALIATTETTRAYADFQYPPSDRIVCNCFLPGYVTPSQILSVSSIGSNCLQPQFSL